MTEKPADGAPWIRRFHPAPDAAVRLVCLPHAGGSASFFFPFSRELAPETEVLCVQYPGRQDRRAEPNIPDLHELADRIAEALTPWDARPTALFGHSMGATLAFEVARRMQAAGRPPRELFVSGRRAPHRNFDDGLHLLPDEELVAGLKELDGTGTEVFGDPDLLDLIVPAIRSDYRAAETYRCAPGPRLSCPVQAFTGFSDPRVPVGELHHWSAHTDGAFDLQVFSGGHFYLLDNMPAILRTVTRRLACIAAC
ncbi:alpha/beta fold hydrolase [Streptomyces sp. NPDC052496]|uniref:thioesterase II family protein n=1 Tax=Streptomyces sp. NPDC052496 TaxID=3154951 RepID=UPI00342DAA45